MFLLNPEIPIRENVMNKALNYSKTLFNSFIYLECNNKKVNYNLKAFVVYKPNNHHISYSIKERKFEEDEDIILIKDDLNYVRLSIIKNLEYNYIAKNEFIQIFIYEKIKTI